MQTERPLAVEANEKLRWLRRLDDKRLWNHLDDRRYCRCCGKSFTARQLQMVEGRQGAPRFTCPTPSCQSTFVDWLYLSEFSGRVGHAPFDAASVMHITRTKRIHPRVGLKQRPKHAGLRRWVLRLKRGLDPLHHFGVLG